MTTVRGPADTYMITVRPHPRHQTPTSGPMELPHVVWTSPNDELTWLRAIMDLELSHSDTMD